MTLGLDLRACDAKLARARKTADTLKRETTARVKEEATHAVRFSQVDPQTGWCTMTLIPQKVEEPQLGAILGDVIHNLRCVLDYVVTALVDASQTQLTTSHQFPIFKDSARYAAKVGTKTDALADGPLRGVIHGLSIVEGWQPYYTQPNPRADPLWGIHRFSNADKHRQPAIFGLIPVGSIQLRYNGILAEQDTVEEVSDWTPEQNIPLGRLRFDPPRAYNLRAEGNISLDVQFVTPPWLGDAALAIPLRALPVIIGHLAKLLDTFRQL